MVKTVTELRAIWLTSPDALEHISRAELMGIEERVHLTHIDNDMAYCGWIRVGTAEVTMNFDKTFDELVPEAIKALDKAESQARGDLQAKLAPLNRLRHRLLAITN
ncbi:hypothetical protein [Bacteriophage sp.]|nr:hypothetical protein [Bacteriophage sp.]